MTRLAFLLAAACPAAFAQAAGTAPFPLGERVLRAIDASPVARAAFWGIQIVDLENGQTLYELNPNRFFVPASNTKLFTTALALVRLGRDYRFDTWVRAAAEPDANGVVRGGLRLVGGGDPNLSARAIPYRIGAATGNPLAAIEDLAAQTVARGVRRVEGDIVGDDTWYVFEPYPPGWGIDDPQYEYGAPVSALTLNDNAMTMLIRPGARPGDPAGIIFEPPLEFYQLDNRVRTIASGERRLRFDREPGGLQLRLWGTIPLKDRGVDRLLGIEDPALWAAMAFRRALERLGVTVSGKTTARHIRPNEIDDLERGPTPDPRAWGVEVAHRISEPLVEDLRVTGKVSQNLHAELALRAVARARRGIGSRHAGIEEMKIFLDELGIERSQYNLVDGSGLARLNLLTPASVMTLLRYMYGSPWREAWIGLLPVAGEDGTLSARFGNSPAKGRIFAKTGSLSHVSTLSGYALRADGGWSAFSILVNNYNASSGEVRGVMDRICNLIVE
jgi:D-alanyl-D-alanine carboxypeptidase/D-alanyl-D-alanine-endopeptidase (penicillin-binding protein 4)